MTMHLEVQAKAHAEILDTCGSDRLPDFNDRESLPYINALAKECFRFHPVAPTGENKLPYGAPVSLI